MKLLFRFKALLDGQFDRDTRAALMKYSHFVGQHIDPERIRLEIIKAMSISNASTFFNSLHIIGALKYIFPSLERCYQEPDHGPYHPEDINIHNTLVGK